MRAKSITDWRPYDAVPSTDWLRRWIGPHAFDVLWRSLFHYKFYELEDSLSAAWLGTRIKRVALSRRNLFQERLGYIEGGSEVLLEPVAERLRELGGTIELRDRRRVGAQRAGGRPAPRSSALRVAGAERRFDAVVSTIPLPYLVPLIPGPAGRRAARIAAIRNVGVVCVLLKLKRPFSRNFWMNINDPRIEIPGLIEYTNLNPLDGSTIVYAPFYMPQTHPKYRRDCAGLHRRDARLPEDDPPRLRRRAT